MSNLAVYSVMVMSLLILLQTVIIAAIFLNLGARSRRLGEGVEVFAQRTASLTLSIRRLLAHIETLHQKLPSWEGEVSRLLAAAVRGMSHADEGLVCALSSLRSGLRSLDESTDRMVSGFSRQTYRVHRAIAHPALHISSLAHAVAAALRRLFEGPRESSARYTSDQELFI